MYNLLKSMLKTSWSHLRWEISTKLLFWAAAVSEKDRKVRILQFISALTRQEMKEL